LAGKKAIVMFNIQTGKVIQIQEFKRTWTWNLPPQQKSRADYQICPALFICL
jgi:hypothetical protein